MDKSIKVYKITADTRHIGCIRFDKSSALLFSGSTIVYDHTNDTFHLFASATQENVEEAAEELYTSREAKKKWNEKKVNRSVRGR